LQHTRWLKTAKHQDSEMLAEKQCQAFSYVKAWILPSIVKWGFEAQHQFWTNTPPNTTNDSHK